MKTGESEIKVEKKLVRVIYDSGSEVLVRELFGLEAKGSALAGEVWGYQKEKGEVKELSSVLDLITIAECK